MPYKVLKDTTLPRTIARGTASDGVEYNEVERVSYAEGQVVFEDDLTDEFIDRAEDGGYAAVVQHISDGEARRLLAEQRGEEVVFPEHEAEAEVLSQDGKDVATHAEVVEANLNGDVVAEPDEPVDLTEGREPDDPGTIRSTEVDEARRGEGEVPEPVPPADDPGQVAVEDIDYDELKADAREFGVSIGGKKKEQLVADVAEAKADAADDDDESSTDSQVPPATS